MWSQIRLRLREVFAVARVRTPYREVEVAEIEDDDGVRILRLDAALVENRPAQTVSRILAALR